VIAIVKFRLREQQQVLHNTIRIAERKLRTRGANQKALCQL
ncbi:hypothetical protein FOFC_04370, partial [Fusarium oxysporum]